MAICWFWMVWYILRQWFLTLDACRTPDIINSLHGPQNHSNFYSLYVQFLVYFFTFKISIDPLPSHLWTPDQEPMVQKVERKLRRNHIKSLSWGPKIVSTPLELNYNKNKLTSCPEYSPIQLFWRHFWNTLKEIIRLTGDQFNSYFLTVKHS